MVHGPLHELLSRIYIHTKTNEKHNGMITARPEQKYFDVFPLTKAIQRRRIYKKQTSVAQALHFFRFLGNQAICSMSFRCNSKNV